MGYIRHHAIVVVGFDRERVEKAHVKAIELGMQVTNIVTSSINAYESFMVTPDGSKESWEESDAGDARRDEYIAWLRAEPKLFLDWAEVELDTERDFAQLTRHRWDTE